MHVLRLRTEIKHICIVVQRKFKVSQKCVKVQQSAESATTSASKTDLATSFNMIKID